MAKIFDRVGMTTATTGTGTITLGSAITDATNGDMLSFADAGVTTADVVNYLITDGNNFEIGTGTYTSTGTTLTRTPALSKIAGVTGTSAISLSGTAKVYSVPANAAGDFSIRPSSNYVYIYTTGGRSNLRMQYGSQTHLILGENIGQNGIAIPSNYSYGMTGGYNSAGSCDVGLQRSASGVAMIGTGFEGGALRKLMVGGFANAFVSKTAAYTATNYDGLIACDATSGAITITLPTAVGIPGHEYVVKKIDSGGNAITIATTSSQTIDGVTTKSLAAQWDKIKVVSNGANWLTV